MGLGGEGKIIIKTMEAEYKRCPYCGEEILAEAKKCKHCGEWLDKSITENQPAEQNEETSKNSPMSSDVRKGVTQAQVNEENSSILIGEILIVAVIIGLYMESWWWFGGSLLGLIGILYVPFLGSFLCIALSAIWGLIGYVVGETFFSQNAAWVLGILAFICGIGIHFSGKTWANDLD